MIALLRQLAQFFTWWFVVAPWEQAIRVRLGKHVRKLEAGFYFRIPFVDKVYKQSVRRRMHVTRPQTLTTQDRCIVTCSGAIGFAIADLVKLFETLEAPNDTIESEVSALVAEFVGKSTLKDCTPAALQGFVLSKLNLSAYGLCGQEFYLTSFATTRTLRLITGELGTWQKDEGLNMREETARQQNAPY